MYIYIILHLCIVLAFLTSGSNFLDLFSGPITTMILDLGSMENGLLKQLVVSVFCVF